MLVEPVGQGCCGRSVREELQLTVRQVCVAVTPRAAVRAHEGVVALRFAQSVEGEFQQVLGGLEQGFGHGFGAFLFNAKTAVIIVFLGNKAGDFVVLNSNP